MDFSSSCIFFVTHTFHGIFLYIPMHTYTLGIRMWWRSKLMGLFGFFLCSTCQYWRAKLLAEDLTASHSPKKLANKPLWKVVGAGPN